MPPVLYNLQQLARGYICIRAAPLLPELINIIAGKYVAIIRELYFAEMIDAQLLIISSATLRILINNIDLFHDYKFYESLQKSALHEINCGYAHPFPAKLEICRRNDQIQIRAILCSCNDINNTNNVDDIVVIVSYNAAREILRTVNENKMRIKLTFDDEYGTQIFRW